jgi:ABC-type nitrate/sulfonate/bicarbonate transport system substrate-binding protein
MTVSQYRERELSRRELLRRAGAGAVAFGLPGVLAACGSSSSSTTSATTGTTAASADPLAVSAGATIPSAGVKFGMAPYGDGSFYVIAMKRGWFKDVGITIEPPPVGLGVTPDNVTDKLVNGEADVATYYGPGRIATMAKAPNLKMFGFSDIYVGTYLLASPQSGAKAVSELVKGGMPFATAIKTAMASVKGKPVAFDSSGEHRDFLTQAFGLGGVKFTDIKLTVTTDPKILALAKGGQVLFASPNGAAQNLALLHDGWFPLVSVQDLLNGLPPGDPRAVASVGHEGPSCSVDYFNKNRETCLRFLSVMFRTIDEIGKHPDQVLGDQVPYLTSVSGVPVSVADLKAIFTVNDPLVPFEKQTAIWDTPGGQNSYQTIYNAQIKSAQAGGVLPKGTTYTADDAINGAETYNQLVALRSAYDALKPTVAALTGAKATLATDAATQYANRNYLDAYRMLKTATAA